MKESNMQICQGCVCNVYDKNYAYFLDKNENYQINF